MSSAYGQQWLRSQRNSGPSHSFSVSQYTPPPIANVWDSTAWAAPSAIKPPQAGTNLHHSPCYPSGSQTAQSYGQTAVDALHHSDYSVARPPEHEIRLHGHQPPSTEASSSALWSNPGSLQAVQDTIGELALAAAPPLMQRRTRLRQPADALWVQYKPELHRLYMEQNNTLPIVIEEMDKNYGFKAT